MGSEQQGVRAPLETGTACLAPRCPSAQQEDVQADCSKRRGRQRRRGSVLLPLACHIPAPCHSHPILCEGAGFAAAGLAAVRQLAARRHLVLCPLTVPGSTQTPAYCQKRTLEQKILFFFIKIAQHFFNFPLLISQSFFFSEVLSYFTQVLPRPIRKNTFGRRNCYLLKKI